jgi:hypothetical protein
LEVIAPGQTNDDLTQPYAMPHAYIYHFFGRRQDFSMRNQYIGHGQHGKWPLDLRTEYGPSTVPEKGSMRVTALGPYELTKDASIGRYDSITVVWAIGTGDVGYDIADSLGKAWFQGEITDEEKNVFIEMGRDSLIQVLDRANWAWNIGLENVPAPPPPPDIVVNSGPRYNTVDWSYPDPDYYLDPHTGVDDWYAWRIYRKEGAYYVDDPDDDYRYLQWEFIDEITDRSQTSWRDTTAGRGVSFYYAVTAMDDGSQNTTGLFPGQKLESSRYANRSRTPAIAFEPGLNVSNRVRVVPNPYSVAGGYMTFSGERDKVLFVNLPIVATLSIYTESGELIKRIDHYGTADNSWDLRTEYRQLVASGLYVLAVHNAKDIEGNSLPEQFVKFVIIR